MSKVANLDLTGIKTATAGEWITRGDAADLGVPLVRLSDLAEIVRRNQLIPTEERLTDLIASYVTGFYWCRRVWSAWHVGTMSADDFHPAEECDLPNELAEAILNELKKADSA